jgi:CheY-like chemotaxis protein
MSKVIVVDDDPTNVGLIKMLLELDGFSVVACTNMAQAKAAAEGAAAFIIDCYLARGASGLDLLQDIRAGATPAAQDTVVIMTSGDYRRSDDARQGGANLFLLKPYSPAVLSEELNRLWAQGERDGQ